MKIFLMAILAQGLSQVSQAVTQCGNSRYQVTVSIYDSSKRCEFDISGPDISLSYMGHIQENETGVECKGMAYTASPYHHGNLTVNGETETLTFENGAAIYLKCHETGSQ